MITARHVTFAVGVVVAFGVSGQSLDNLYRANQEGNNAARASQERIDQVVNQTRDLAAEYSAVMKEVDGLIVFNRIMEKQIEIQEGRLRTLDQSMDQVSVVERQVIPLMVRMIDGLEMFVNLDVPFLLDERTNRVDTLRQMMEKDNVSSAEKFRRVLESYEIENDYGRTIEAYKGELTVDGVARDVDFLKIGRIGLYYQTLDTVYSGMWDRKQKQWVSLGNDYRAEIREGLRMARDTAPPNLLSLPIPAAEG